MRTCDKCHGSGRLPGNEPPATEWCRGFIVIGHETMECAARLEHPGEPHMQLSFSPCAECGGHEDHAEGCSCPPDVDTASYWWAWRDGDTVWARAEDGQEWRRRFAL